MEAKHNLKAEGVDALNLPLFYFDGDLTGRKAMPTRRQRYTWWNGRYRRNERDRDEQIREGMHELCSLAKAIIYIFKLKMKVQSDTWTRWKTKPIYANTI